MTRRIDELGRLVIPKEIRKNLKIKDNDQIEISIVNDKIVLSKYDYLKKDDIIHQLLLCTRKVLNKNVLFTSRDKIIDYSLLYKENMGEVTLSNEMINAIENRREVINSKSILIYENKIFQYSIIEPLIVNGDLYGSLILYSDNEINEINKSIIMFAKTFLEFYLE